MCRIVSFFSLVLITMTSSFANDGYRLPPQEVVDLIDAPPEPNVSFSPDGRFILYLERSSLPTIDLLARRMLKLAGQRIDPMANSSFQIDYLRGVRLRKMDSQEETRVPLPIDAKISGVSWSHRSNAFVLTLLGSKGTELWWVDLQDPTHPKLLTDRLSTVLSGFDWMPDGKSILACLVPKDRGPEPAALVAPIGPNIQQATGTLSPTRTYQDLLTNPYDEALFKYYGTSQLAILSSDGTCQEIHDPAMFVSAVPSPDGEHLLITRMLEPFSYLLPSAFFPKSIEVWNRQGEKVYQVAEVPLEENIPIEGVRTGPRAISWRPRHSASLIWTEALDGGDPKRKVDHREKIMTIAAPFDQSPQELFKLTHRFSGLAYFESPTKLIATELDRDRRWTTSRVYDFSDPNSEPRIVVDRSIRDRYGDPGRILTQADESGYPIAIEKDGKVYLAGQGATPEGFSPFLDVRDMTTLETKRLWQCSEGSLESVVKIIDIPESEKPIFVTRHEAPASPPNYFLHQVDGGTRKQLTHFVDPTPQIRGIKKQIVKYSRPDGVPLSATLYLPADYQPGTRLPLLVWAYPLEFNDASTAGQVAASPFQFTRMASISHLTLVTQGYAVMDDATMPVVGDPETMNDTFIEQIVAAAKAAIDHAVELGVADRNRVAVGGHSYGAFMTANLMAHSDLFRAGIARSGAYNRTLTPLVFNPNVDRFGKPKKSIITSRRLCMPTKSRTRS